MVGPTRHCDVDDVPHHPHTLTFDADPHAPVAARWEEVVVVVVVVIVVADVMVGDTVRLTGDDVGVSAEEEEEGRRRGMGVGDL